MKGPLAIAIGTASPAGIRGRLSILIFHRVLAMRDPLFPGEPDADRFDRMLGWIRAWFNVLPLDDAVRRLSSGDLPARAAAITFDDGYADNFHVALPILQRHRLAATFFIATGFLDGGCMWNDRIIAAVRDYPDVTLDLESEGLGRHPLSSLDDRRSTIEHLLRRAKYLPMGERDAVARRISDLAHRPVPSDLMMATSEVRTLRAAGMEIGAHTVSHPILATIAPDDARHEMGASKTALEEILQEPVELFAYPNGKPGTDYLHDHAIMARELGFAAAVSTGWGAADHETDRMQLPRFTPWDSARGRFGLRMLGNLFRSPLLAGTAQG